jgi:hypothetical protein
MVKEGETRYIKSPTEVGTGRAKDEKAPLSEIIEVLNERFGTQFTEEDRLFFQQIKEKPPEQAGDQTALANRSTKSLGSKMVEDLMIERMADNDRSLRYIATRSSSGGFPILAREIFSDPGEDQAVPETAASGAFNRSAGERVAWRPGPTLVPDRLQVTSRGPSRPSRFSRTRAKTRSRWRPFPRGCRLLRPRDRARGGRLRRRGEPDDARQRDHRRGSFSNRQRRDGCARGGGGGTILRDEQQARASRTASSPGNASRK